MKLIFSSILICVVTALISTACAPPETKFVTIGTGGVTGLYYPTGGAISRMLNKEYKLFKIKATVESTSGSVFNINAVLQGDMEFGVAQSDRQYQAYNGLAEWAEIGPQKDLRSIFSIHAEPITLVVSENSAIDGVADLAGKRINLGNPGSGQLQNSKDVIAAAGLLDEDLQAEYVKAVEAPGLLQDERLDGFFYTVGHPNGNIKEATSGRIKVKIIPITGNIQKKMLEKYPYYAEAIIPQEFYPRALNNEDIETIGVKATFITSRATDEDVVYAVTKVVFDNFEEFKELHPAYKTLTRENMLKGLTAPVHTGALRYYREKGLDSYIDENLILE
jgi:TRAP transporter TAXI family solute receptor